MVSSRGGAAQIPDVIAGDVDVLEPAPGEECTKPVRIEQRVVGVPNPPRSAAFIRSFVGGAIRVPAKQPVIGLGGVHRALDPLLGNVTGVGHPDIELRAGDEDPRPFPERLLDQFVALMLQHVIGSQGADARISEGQRIQAADDLDPGKGKEVGVDLVTGVGVLACADLDLHRGVVVPQVAGPYGLSIEGPTERSFLAGRPATTE